MYEKNASQQLEQTEIPVYGSGRLGMAQAAGGSVVKYVYELTDHLGNVRATITENSGQAQLLNTTDYYPFGWETPNRNSIAEPYRFGYQGQFAEKDPETGLNQFEARLFDSRAGRWLTTDPAGQYWSPYLGMGNNPVSGVDPDGRDYYQNEGGQVFYKDGNAATATFGGVTYNNIGANYAVNVDDQTGVLFTQNVGKVVNLGDYTSSLTWQSQFQSQFNNSCFKASKAILENANFTVSTKIQAAMETAQGKYKLTSTANQAFDRLNNSFGNGQPLMIGVSNDDYVGDVGNGDNGTTDHHMIATGFRILNGKLQMRYLEVGTSVKLIII